MTKLLKTLGRMYCARRIEEFCGGIRGLERAYNILREAYPENPFVEGFCNGGAETINAYKRAIRARRQVSEMDSIKDLFWIGFHAQKYQFESQQKISVPEFHFDMPEMTFSLKSLKH